MKRKRLKRDLFSPPHHAPVIPALSSMTRSRPPNKSRSGSCRPSTVTLRVRGLSVTRLTLMLTVTVRGCGGVLGSPPLER